MLDFEEAGVQAGFEMVWSEISSMAQRLRSSIGLLITLALFVSPAALVAQDLGGAAKILVMSGRVSVLKDGMEWARAMGDVVEPRQIIVTGLDGYAKFQLADGSTFEVADFNPTTGALMSRGTFAGYSDSSTWARGQAWALYGFVQAYQTSGNAAFLMTAEDVANYFVNHLPGSYIPP